MENLNPIQAGTPEVPQPNPAQSFVDKVAIPALTELNSAYADAVRRKEAADKARQAEQDAANAELALMASGGELPADIKQQSVAWQMTAMLERGRAIATEETNRLEQEFNQSPEAFLQKHGSMTNAFQQMAERWKPQIEQDEYAQRGFVESLTQKQQALSQMESRFVMQKQQETAVNDVQTNLAAAFDTVLRQPIVAPSQQQPVTAPPVAAKSTTGKGKKFSQDVESVIATVSQKSGVPLEYMRVMAQIESSGNPLANRGPKSAKGLFQFVPGTARAYGIAGKELDLQANTEAAARLTIDNMKALQGYGIDVNDPQNHYLLYLAHQQGAGGALEIIRAAKSGGNVSAVVRANMDNNGGRGKSPQEFLDSWRAKYEKNLAIVGSSSGVQGSPSAPTPSAQTTTTTSPAPTATPTTITSAPISPDQIEALKKNIEAQGFVHPQGSNAAHEIAANALLQMAVQHNRPEVLTPEFFNQLGIGNQYGGKLPQVLAAQGQINRNADIERNAQLKQQEEQLKIRGTLFAESVQAITKDDFVTLTPENADYLRKEAMSKLQTGEISHEKFLSLSEALTNKIEFQNKAIIKTQAESAKAQLKQQQDQLEMRGVLFADQVEQITRNSFAPMSPEQADELRQTALAKFQSGEIKSELYLRISTALTNKIEEQKKVEVKAQAQRQKQLLISSKDAARAALNNYVESLKQGKPIDKTEIANKLEGLVNISEKSTERVYEKDAAEITKLVAEYSQNGLITATQAQSYLQKIGRNVTDIQSEIDKEIAKQQEEKLKISGTLFVDAVNKITADSFVTLTPELSDQIYEQARSKMETGEISHEKFLTISTALTNKLEAQKKAEIKAQVQQQKQELIAGKNAVRASLNGYIESLRQNKVGDKAGVVNSIDGLVKVSEQSAEPIYQRDVDEITKMVTDAYQQGLLTAPQAQSYIQKINRNVSKIESDFDKEIAKQEKAQKEAADRDIIKTALGNALSGKTPSAEVFSSLLDTFNNPDLSVSKAERNQIVDSYFSEMGKFSIDIEGNATEQNQVAVVPTGLTSELASKSLAVFSATGHTPAQYQFFSGQLAALTGDLPNKKFADVMPQLDAYTNLIAKIEAQNPNTYDNLLKGDDGKLSEGIYRFNKHLLSTNTPAQQRFTMLLNLKDNQKVYEQRLSQMDAVTRQKFVDLSIRTSEKLKDLEKAGYKQFIDAVIPAFASQESAKPSYLRWGVGFFTNSKVDFVDGLPDAAKSYAERLAAYEASGMRNAEATVAKEIANEYETVLVPNISFKAGRPAPIDAWALDIKPTEDRAVSSGDVFAKAILIPKSALNKPIAVKSMGKLQPAQPASPKELSKVIETQKKQILLEIAKKVSAGKAITPQEWDIFDDPNKIEVKYLKETNTLFIKRPGE